MPRRHHSSLERTQSGLGIGLTLVKRLVEMHGGTVAASSSGLSRGSEFIVRLPELAEQPAPVSVEEVRNDKPVTPRRILVVDDNIDAAQSLSMLLTLEGHQTIVAHSGRTALELAVGPFRPEVVLLDIGLPEMNGYEVARAIRASSVDPVTLIALTGWGQDSDKTRSQEAGFNGHLVKPVDYDALRSLLAKQITSRAI